MSRIIEGHELEGLKQIIEAARLEGAKATCQKDSRGVVVFRGQDILGKASNGPLLPYGCNPDRCAEVCGLYAMHAERLAIINALASGKDLSGASILHVRVDNSEVQISGKLRCEDCTGYMRRFSRKNIFLKEFVLFQQDGWNAYSIEEADQITRRNLGLL